MDITIISLLTNFGAFGSALGVVGSVGWVVWCKVIVPQQKELRKQHEEHIKTLQKIAENSGQITQEFIVLSKENIATLKELNGKITTHHNQMHVEHKRNIDLIKNIKK